MCLRWYTYWLSLSDDYTWHALLKHTSVSHKYQLRNNQVNNLRERVVGNRGGDRERVWELSWMKNGFWPDVECVGSWIVDLPACRTMRHYSLLFINYAVSDVVLVAKRD